MSFFTCVRQIGPAPPEKRQAEEQKKVTEEQTKITGEQKRWQQKLAAYSNEQLRFKLAGLEQAVARGKEGMDILLRQGNGFGVLIAQGQFEDKVKERDAVGLELIRRGGVSEAAPPSTKPNRSDPTQPKASGTGFFITEDGYFVTCHHVVDNASKILVQTKNGSFPVKVVREDKGNDLAILKADGAFTALPIVSSGPVKLGQNAFTIGFPNPGVQGNEAKFTRGEISSKTGIQDDPRLFQISVAVQPGNSGGPLVDQAGNVVGVVVSRLSDVKTLKLTGSLPQNVNYAVKSSFVNTVLESLPDVAIKLKEAHTEKERKFDDVVSEAETAVAMVVVY